MAKNQWQFQNSNSIHFISKKQQILIPFNKDQTTVKTCSNPCQSKKTIS